MCELSYHRPADDFSLQELDRQPPFVCFFFFWKMGNKMKKGVEKMSKGGPFG